MSQPSNLPAVESDEAELKAVIENVLSRHFATKVNVARLMHRPFAYSTSFSLDELEIGLDNGEVISLLRKDLGPEGLQEAALKVKPAFLWNPMREIEAYRRVLSGSGLGTAVCYGTVVDPQRGRYWLFLERVPGVELYQVGELVTWQQVARWLAAMHVQFAEKTGKLGRAAPLLHYDPGYYRLWLERTQAFVPKGALRLKGMAWASWERLVRRYDRVIGRLAALPQTLIHGEFYASNVLVCESAEGLRVCPVDWEMAAAGPGLIDLAALTAGHWTEEEQNALAEAYFEAAQAGGLWPAGREAFRAALDDCRLHLAMQWLGWSPHWSPPTEHTQDWLAEALRLAEKIGL